MSRKWQYKVTKPMLRPGAESPVMDFRDMEDWLDEMDERGWEFVAYGQKNWTSGMIQEWWIFRKPAE